jgi:hypothetical protein
MPGKTNGNLFADCTEAIAGCKTAVCPQCGHNPYDDCRGFERNDSVSFNTRSINIETTCLECGCRYGFEIQDWDQYVVKKSRQ